MPVIERERQGQVEILTMNRPEARNAINVELSRAMSSAFGELADDDECSVVVLTGSGDKAFCAGMDLKALAAGQGETVMTTAGGFAGITRRSFPKPVIAAINGAALAGGCEIMLACDLAVAAEHATFGVPEVKRGLIASAGALFRLPNRLPLAVALELALTGETIDASRALALGLVNRVVPRARLIEEAVALAQLIAENAPLSVRWSKKVMLDALGSPEEEAWQANLEAMDAVMSSADAMEGSVAFAEKRRPKWRGR
jgi:enoyl-CoA hydratase/carnithine racemase